MSVNRATVQGAFDLTEFLQSKGYACTIGGGFARDTFFGVPPKDIDIVVATVPSDYQKVEEILQQAGYEFVKFRIYNEAKGDRLIGGFKLVGTDIDVVLYDVPSVSDAVEAFDFNLNQFVVSGISRGIDEATIRFQGSKHWSELVPVRQDYSQDRYNKMMTKFIDLTWRVKDPDTQEVPVGGPNGTY
jgi:hypothetical protein